MFEKVKSLGRKLVALVSVAALSCVTAISMFAAEGDAVNPYDAISTEIQSQATSMFTSAQTMVLAVIGAGLVIFGIFLMFKLGKKGIKSAVNG